MLHLEENKRQGDRRHCVVELTVIAVFRAKRAPHEHSLWVAGNVRREDWKRLQESKQGRSSSTLFNASLRPLPGLVKTRQGPEVKKIETASRCLFCSSVNSIPVFRADVR